MMARRFRKKPVIIEATVWDGVHLSPLRELDPEHKQPFAFVSDGSGSIIVQTLEGPLTASPGDWIIKGVTGEFYPCKPDVFDLTYEGVP